MTTAYTYTGSSPETAAWGGRGPLRSQGKAVASGRPARSAPCQCAGWPRHKNKLRGITDRLLLHPGSSRGFLSPPACSSAFLSAALGPGSGAGWLSIRPGSQQGSPIQRGFSFSPAAIFRGLGSTDGASLNGSRVAKPRWSPQLGQPARLPHTVQARPSWGAAV